MMRNCCLAVVTATFVASGCNSAAAFTPPSSSLSSVSATISSSSCCISPSLQLSINNNDSNDNIIHGGYTLLSEGESNNNVINRRRAVQQFSLAFLSSSIILESQQQPANANDDLFKSNPLTNPVFEKLRIINQDEADNIKYGGELESGSAKPTAFDQYVQLLQPILIVDNDLTQINKLLKEDRPKTKDAYSSLFQQIDTILSKSLFDKINFKKAFNAFADNIYYSDPDRANLYLGGGAEPTTIQSIAYLLRNDILTNIEDMRAEVKFLLKELEKNGVDEAVNELDEIYGLNKVANEAMKKYLDLVPPNELKSARGIFEGV